MKGLGRGEGVGHQPVEEYPLTQHPRVSAALKVNLQEGEELTPRLKKFKKIIIPVDFGNNVMHVMGKMS